MEKTMLRFIRQTLTNPELNMALAYGESRHAPHDRDHSGPRALAATQEYAADLSMTVQQYTVAIVDDDPALLKALGRLLVESGYGVELFAAFDDVLKRIATSRAACILIDCQLGQYCGIELARQLAASGIQLPVIFMTASDDDRLREQAAAIGCAGFLRKPFYVDELREVIDNLQIT
jgi:CheY-like chemotaxis protein